MRRVPALLVAAGLLIATLSGCSAGADSSCRVQPGDASKLVSAVGKFGSTKTAVHFPTPLFTDSVQRSTLVKGTGAPLEAGQFVDVNLQLLDGATGKTEQNGRNGLTVGSTAYPGLGKAMQCVPVGSRISVVGSARQIFGKAGVASTGLSGSEQLVFVIDVKQAFIPYANGAPRPSRSGFPTVVLAPSGQPGVKIPTTPAPKTVQTETLKQGNGQALKKGNVILAQYTQVAWNDNSVTNSSWKDGNPAQWSIGKADKQVQPAPAGVSGALVGARVGSQLVVIVPATSASASASAFVVDILGVLKQ